MANFCGECRFSGGNKCTLNNNCIHSKTISCSRFAHSTSCRSLESLKVCADCKFFCGSRCLLNNSHVFANRIVCSSAALN